MARGRRHSWRRVRAQPSPSCEGRSTRVLPGITSPIAPRRLLRHIRPRSHAVRSGISRRLDMMLTLAKLHLDASPSVWGHRLVLAATLAGWLALVALIAS